MSIKRAYIPEIPKNNVNDLIPGLAYKNPKMYDKNNTLWTLDTKDLKELYMAYDGTITSCGEIWILKNKRLCPGVYRVWIEKKYLGPIA